MNNNLVSTFWPQVRSQLLAKTALVIAGIVLLTISSKIQVPFWPVPMTLQSLVVLIIGASYGARLAGTTLLSYLATGAIGLPVFAKGAGLAYMAGPTGGYLIGFLAAAIVVGWLADRGFGRTLLSALAILAAGELVLFSLGVSWLAIAIGLQKAVAGGLMPFIPAEVLKVALACAALDLAWRRSKT
jgi:biotin transport system substrate-specific component